MFLRIVLEANEEQHTVEITEDEDARKVLRAKLGVKRLPPGTKTISVSPIPMEELTSENIKKFLELEKPRLQRLTKFYTANPDMGRGWQYAIESATTAIDKATSILKDRNAE
jgi:hypothetical protein